MRSGATLASGQPYVMTTAQCALPGMDRQPV